MRGRVGIVLLAGGLDSRLGEEFPKAMIDVGLLSKKSIFQLYAERLRRLQHLVHRKTKHSVHVPLYIMCNQQNRETIADFFHENHYFGLRRRDIMFFTQTY